MIHGTYYYAETWEEKLGLINEIMENMKSEDLGAPGISAGESACLMFADRRHTADTFDWWPDNYLRVSVNAATGYGGLTWFVSAERADERKDEISQSVWVSDNPTPPDFDPRVVSDPGFPLFYDAQSTLPATQVRAALEEFCRAETGERPACINWVPGEMNGSRLTDDE
ncbi:Imm1 family immunity protein [Streptomyces sp. cg36]|uniref:Imm1 family immunity protein n=1 Tax=Streptomyces sp. cg36 TaxID=3238798 RepID=UPI0034E27F07